MRVSRALYAAGPILGTLVLIWGLVSLFFAGDQIKGWSFAGVGAVIVGSIPFWHRTPVQK